MCACMCARVRKWFGEVVACVATTRCLKLSARDSFVAHGMHMRMHMHTHLWDDGLVDPHLSQSIEYDAPPVRVIPGNELPRKLVRGVQRGQRRPRPLRDPLAVERELVLPADQADGRIDPLSVDQHAARLDCPFGLPATQAGRRRGKSFRDPFAPGLLILRDYPARGHGVRGSRQGATASTSGRTPAAKRPRQTRHTKHAVICMSKSLVRVTASMTSDQDLEPPRTA